MGGGTSQPQIDFLSFFTGGQAPQGTQQLVEKNGKTYLFNSTTGTLTLAPAELQTQPESIRVNRRETHEFANPRGMGSRMGELYPGGTTRRDVDVPYDLPIDDPETINAALSGDLGLQGWKVLAELGLPDSLIKDLFFPEADAGGGGGSATAWAQLAMQKQQNEINNALAIYESLAGQQAQEDRLAALAQEATLKALPLSVDPSMTHFPGVSPNDPIVGQYGLTSAVPIRHTPFSPQLPIAPTKAAAQQAFETFRSLAGAA